MSPGCGSSTSREDRNYSSEAFRYDDEIISIQNSTDDSRSVFTFATETLLIGALNSLRIIFSVP